MPDLLIEIGCEEIPARMIDDAREELKRRILDLLSRERLLSAAPADAHEAKAYSTPRRLAVVVSNVRDAQPEVEETVNGPAVKVAFKDGVPTAAAEAFAKRVGKPVEQMQRVSTPKGEYLAATVKQRGRAAVEVLGETLAKEFAGLYWAKNMYWRAGKPERFVRPVRWITALLDDRVVHVGFAGKTSQAATRGHRVLSDGEIKVRSAADYADAMRKAKVIADPEERRSAIARALEAAVPKGFRVRRDDALLATVTNLTESPSVVLGGFDKEYLALPEEVLVTVMRDHQKYFAVEDGRGKLAPYFLAVLNIEADDGAREVIRHGNERVLRARFNDARFFWITDQRFSLEDRTAMLKAVTFEKDLGSYAEKSARTARLIDWLVQQLPGTDAGAAGVAAQLAKCDLTTELVKEFTELQGTIGGLYARAQGHTEAVVTAIYDQYKPVSMEDEVPRTREAAAVSIADKADSIAGMFALGLIPSGSKDPFALRRAANGIVKTVAEHKLRLKISALMAQALAGYSGSDAEARFKNTDYSRAVAAFFRERMEFYLRDVRGYAYDVVSAVLAADAGDVSDALLRAEAVSAVRKSGDFEAISLSFKRMKNILRQAGEKNLRIAADEAALVESEEQRLAEQAHEVSRTVREASARGDYAAALREIAKLRPALDAFFDKVMVMVDDERTRAARLALLQWIYGEFSTIADFSEIVTESK